MPRRSNSVACCEGGACSYRSRSPVSAADAILWQACAGRRTTRQCTPGRPGARRPREGPGNRAGLVNRARSDRPFPQPEGLGSAGGPEPRDVAPVTPCRSTVAALDHWRAPPAPRRTPSSTGGAEGASPDRSPTPRLPPSGRRSHCHRCPSQSQPRVRLGCSTCCIWIWNSRPSI